MSDVVRLSGVLKPGAMQPSLGLCIYGKGGVGKTTLVGTMPGEGLLIDVPQLEGGTFVINNDKIDVKEVSSWNEIETIFTFLQTQKHPYKWVAIDSITAFTELAKRKAIKERTLEADPHQISQNEWGKVGRLVAELVYKFRTLKIHTIWIAQERKLGGDDEIGTSATLVPDTTPAALQALIPSMMLVGRLSVEQSIEGEWERHLRIGPHPVYYTKVRGKPGLDIPYVIRNPRLDVLLKFLLGTGERPDEVKDEASFVIVG